MEGPKKTSPGVLTSVWMPLFTSPLIYLAMGFLLRRANGVPPGSTDMLAALTPVFAVLTVLQVITIFLVLPKFSWKMPALPFYLTRWALAEASAVYGFVLFVLGAPWAVFLVFSLVGLAILWVLRPGLG